MISDFTHGCLRRVIPLDASVLAILLSTFETITPIEADDDRHVVERAIESGEVESLQRLLARIRQDFDGRVLKVELERENYAGRLRWIYEAKILTDSGDVLELEYDAQALELLEVEGRRSRDE